MTKGLVAGFIFNLFLVMSVPASSTSAASALAADSAVSLQERPVMKVVRLLEDTSAELKKELEDDEKTHEALTCWCNSNNEEKKAAIAAGTATSKQLEADIDEGKGQIAESLAKRKAAMEEKNADIASLQKAREMRMEENKEFQQTETDLIEAVAACKGATTALSKHHADFAQVRAAASHVLDSRYVRALKDQRVTMLRSFMGAHGTSFLSIPGYKSYAPQSGQIFGILKQMQEDFEATLSEEQKAEAKAVKEFDAMVVAKKAEIKTGEEVIIAVDAKLAELGEDKAHDIKALEDTMVQLEMDKEFLATLEEKCAADASEYDARVKSRMEEIMAVEDTIKILNSPESFEAFDKMVITAFVQRSAVASREQQRRRQRAVSVLQRAAGQAAAPKLALIAASVQLDSFTEVKAEIDKMVVQLKKQQQDEVDFRDGCVDDLAENKAATAAGYDKKDSLIALISDLENKIAANTKAIAKLTSEVEKTKEEMKKSSETREAENAEFQQTVADHRLMQMILQKAIARMSQAYALLQRRAAPHIQTSGTHTDPGNAPARFGKYEQNAGGKKVIAMLENVLAECAKTETAAIVDETDSQAAYETLMKDSNKAIIQMSKTIADLTEALATNKVSLSSAKADLKGTMDVLEGLDATNKDLHASCDYVLDNFVARQAARAAEMDALGEAKAILSGAS
mmetsp:Transcript_120346/g.208879  ORF Transcript_120346/g.208879 Transcript_120346/m.208879 type:complete len:685 (+) Transcript_120346:83-2137(+)